MVPWDGQKTPKRGQPTPNSLKTGVFTVKFSFIVPKTRLFGSNFEGTAFCEKLILGQAPIDIFLEKTAKFLIQCEFGCSTVPPIHEGLTVSS